MGPYSGDRSARFQIQPSYLMHATSSTFIISILSGVHPCRGSERAFLRYPFLPPRYLMYEPSQNRCTSKESLASRITVSAVSTGFSTRHPPAMGESHARSRGRNAQFKSRRSCRGDAPLPTDCPVAEGLRVCSGKGW